MLLPVNDKQNAAAVPITDSGGYYTATDVEAALQEIGLDAADYLFRDGSRTLTGSLLPDSGGTIDLGADASEYRTIFLENDGGNVAVCRGVQSGSGATNYTFGCGGGQWGADQNQGGTFTFKMGDISSSLGTSVNKIIFDPGRPDVFAAGTTNDVIFQAYNGVATYGFVSSFGGWNDLEYGLELRRISGTESNGKTLIFDNQTPVSDFRRSIDFRIDSVNKLTIENTGEVVVTDRFTSPRIDVTAIQNGAGIGTGGVAAATLTGYLNFFGLNWFDFLTLDAETTNLGCCFGVFPNGTATTGLVNSYNSSNTGAAAWLSMGVRGATAELVVRDFSQTTNITELNIGSGGNDFAVFDLTCTTLVDVNIKFAGVTEYNFTTGAFTLSDGNNIAAGTGTGTKVGTATSQKLGFWNSTPIAQPSSTGETSGFTAGAGTGVNDDSTFTGNVGSKAYRISDIVKHLKSTGLIAA